MKIKISLWKKVGSIQRLGVTVAGPQYLFYYNSKQFYALGYFYIDSNLLGVYSQPQTADEWIKAERKEICSKVLKNR